MHECMSAAHRSSAASDVYKRQHEDTTSIGNKCVLQLLRDIILIDYVHVEPVAAPAVLSTAATSTAVAPLCYSSILYRCCNNVS